MSFEEYTLNAVLDIIKRREEEIDKCSCQYAKDCEERYGYEEIRDYLLGSKRR